MKTQRVRTDDQKPSGINPALAAIAPIDTREKAEAEPASNGHRSVAATSKRAPRTKLKLASTEVNKIEKLDTVGNEPSVGKRCQDRPEAVRARSGEGLSVLNENFATETPLRQAEREIATLKVRLDEISAERDRMRAEVVELHAALDRRTAEWSDQSKRMADAKARLSDALVSLNEEFAAAETRLQQSDDALAVLERHSKWAGEQIAVLVEREAEAQACLAGKESEIRVAEIRIEELQAELRSAEAALRGRAENEAVLRDGAIRHLGTEIEQTTPTIEIFAAVYRHQRVLERELDREIAERQRITAALEDWERSAYAGAVRFSRRLFAKRQLLRALPNALRRA